MKTNLTICFLAKSLADFVVLEFDAKQVLSFLMQGLLRMSEIAFDKCRQCVGIGIKHIAEKRKSCKLVYQVSIDMQNTDIEKIFRTFIHEVYEQKRIKHINPHLRSNAVGLRTEIAVKDFLKATFYNEGLKIHKHRIKVDLSLGLQDFIDAGLPDSKGFVKSFSNRWQQCDLPIHKDKKLIILGEVKTTTSASHNICALINKGLTAVRHFNVAPLSILLYPDIKPSTLKQNYSKIVSNLYENRAINNFEKEFLSDCYFVLTNIRWKGDLSKRIEKIDFEHNQGFQALLTDNLLQSDDVNQDECTRMLKYIAHQTAHQWRPMC